jgi:hypothetical protein
MPSENCLSIPDMLPIFAARASGYSSAGEYGGGPTTYGRHDEHIDALELIVE